MIKNLKLNHFIYALIGISFVAYFIILKYIQPVQEETFINYLKIIPTVVTVDTVLVLLFTQHIWKLRIFKGWLVPFPNLNGTYKGIIRTTWEDPITKERPASIPTILTIKQSFFRISCVMRTEEMTSYSFICDFILDKDNQEKQLSYSYRSYPKQIVVERSPQHRGTIVFEIDETPKIRLVGEYWTDRKTTGTIEMEFWRKKKLNTFPANLGKHPVSEARNKKANY
jgi:hypothetical protein